MTTAQTEHVRWFIEAIHRRIGPTRAVQFRALREKDVPQERWLWDHRQLPDVVGDLLQLNAAGWNVFIGIQPRASLAGGERTNIAASTVLAVDYDLISKGGRWEFITSELNRLKFPQPTIVVNSGNGRHAYWLLNEEVSIDLAEEVGKRLCALCASDHVWNASRVMRLPGTINWKSPPRWCFAERIGAETVSLGEIDDRLTRIGLPAFEEVALPATEVEVPASLHQALQNVPGVMRDVILTGRHHFPSNSEADWAVAVALFSAGCSVEQVREAFLTLPCGGLKVLASPRSYLERTLDRAKSQVDRDRAERLRGLSLPSPPFEEIGDGRWTIRQTELYSAKRFWR